jgi:autotransporter-associated beta strand protein
VFNLDRAILRTSLALIAASAAIGATIDPARAQQYFNGSQTTPNGVINGGGGVWNNTTTNWTNDPGTASNPYDPSALTTTVFGASTTSIPPTAGIVTVAPGGIQLTGDVQFQATGDNSIYTIQGGNLTVATGGTTFEVSNVSAGPGPSAIISSSIVGTNGVNIDGPGTLILAGTNTYTGGTFICACGSLQLGDAIGDITNNGQFAVVNANTSGIASITNFGVTDFVNTTTAGTATITNRGGLLTFNDFATAGNASITNRFGGEIDFNNNSNAGSATIVNRFNTSTFFYDNSDARNANITNRFFGQTVFNDLSSAGSAVITTLNGGRTVFNDNSNGGNAQFITNGSGYVDFSGSSGPLGDFHITAGSIAGSGFYFIGAGNLLTVGSNNLSTEVSGVIADVCGCGPTFPGGTLEKVGTGTLTLSGINTYTGGTLVNGGSLLVTGSIASSSAVVVDNGATLGGTGTVAATLLFNGATLAPGLPTALGTLTVNDVLGFCSCTFYDVKVTSAGNDLTSVVLGLHAPGFASLAGTVQVRSLDSTYRFNSPYTILTAQAGFGPTQFDTLVTPTGINGSLSYTLTDVNLTLLSALGQLPGLNINQHNVATHSTARSTRSAIPAVWARSSTATSRSTSARPPVKPRPGRSRRPSMRWTCFSAC